MTPDWLATEDGKRAVEATVEKGCECRHCEAERDEARRYITAALPFLDRMFRERYAKELEAEAKLFVAPYPEWEGTVSTEKNTLRWAASFLRREPTL